VMNAAVGFYAAGRCETIPAGRSLAEEAIDSKKALETLKKLVKLSHT